MLLLHESNNSIFHIFADIEIEQLVIYAMILNKHTDVAGPYSMLFSAAGPLIQYLSPGSKIYPSFDF